MAHSGGTSCIMIQGLKMKKKLFATLLTINWLEPSGNWLKEGLFSTAPNVLSGYAIYSQVDGIKLPLVYALLPDKKELLKTTQFACGIQLTLVKCQL